MGQMLENMQFQIKKSSATIGLISLKLFTGFILGLALTMIAQEIFNYGQFLFWFVIMVTTTVFMKLSKFWKLTGTGVFIFICLLIGLLLKLYIHIAPGN